MRLTLNDNEIQKLLECIKSDKTQEQLFSKILYKLFLDLHNKKYLF